jgi:hypothetical protein
LAGCVRSGRAVGKPWACGCIDDGTRGVPSSGFSEEELLVVGNLFGGGGRPLARVAVGGAGAKSLVLPLSTADGK